MRHGARTILKDFPNDINKPVWDKYGMGQLLPIGMRQSREFGAYMAKKYASFLNPVYSASRVFARSTDYDRTLQTVLTFLAGMYKPSKDQAWTDEPDLAGYMPIPVRTNKLSSDDVIPNESN